MDERTKGQAAKEKVAGTEKMDNLTGILSKSSAEIRIAAVMRGGGSFFICDIDCLKKINDRYGHLMGDECLKHVAKTLGYMVRKDDILGRLGGDEFVIFMPDCDKLQQAWEIVERIENRFRNNGKKSGYANLSVTAACTVWKKGDTFRQIFERAVAELSKRKTDLSINAELKKDTMDNYKRDVQKVRADLMEQISKPGAYCRNYETFKSIYRFLERGIIRSGQKACVILISVVDESGKILLPDEKDMLMDQLGENIRVALRIGDVYTRYTSSQYLVLVIDTTEGQADRIANRVMDKFLMEHGENGLLVHYCYELQPARIVEIGEKEVE